jgi:alpha-beta hydrolase superfamily lysophospholipase
MSRPVPFPTNLELRESNPDGTEGAGLSHTPGGMFLLRVLELAAAGEPRGGVTIVHDAGDHGARYEELAQVLAADGWAVSMPDLRGHGATEGPRGHSWGFAEIERDLVAVQDHLCFMFPESPKVLVGVGLGALYCAAFASEHPERAAALVVANPVLEPRFQLPRPPSGLGKLFKKVGPTTPGAIGWKAEDLTGDPAEQAKWRADRLVHGVITVRTAETARELSDSLPGRLARLACPAFVLCGDADPIADPARTAALDGGNRRLQRFSGKHLLFHDRCAADARDFVRVSLNRVLPRGARS